jgi:hypothetical protein
MTGPSEKMQVTGRLTIVLKGPDGSVKDTRDIKNLVVNTGLAHITSRMLGTSSGVMTHMALGAGTAAAAAGNTTLGSQLGSRKVFDSAVQSGTNNEAITYITTFAAGEATGSVTEAGIFNASTSGTMLCRTVFSVVTKGAADVLLVTWTVAFAG